MARLIGVAGLSITLAALTDVPGGGADLEIACEADVAVGKGEADADDEIARGLRGEVGTAGMIDGGGGVEGDIRLGLTTTSLTTNPFTIATLIVVAIEGQAIALWA